MQTPSSAIVWSVLRINLVSGYLLPAQAADTGLQGTWIATEARRDGKAAEDVVGHTLSISENTFEISSKNGKHLYAGNVRIDSDAKPAAIDFEHKEGDLSGKSWKGVYALEGDTLKICDNAPNLNAARPTALKAPSGSGYVLVTFKRAKP